MNAVNPPTFEQFAVRYFSASEDLKRAALTAAMRAFDNEPAPLVDEPLLALNELPPFFGLKHYTSLARLQVQRVGISFGGRLRYRVSDVRRWLQSPECDAIREHLREKRQQDNDKRMAAGRQPRPSATGATGGRP